MDLDCQCETTQITLAHYLALDITFYCQYQYRLASDLAIWQQLINGSRPRISRTSAPKTFNTYQIKKTKMPATAQGDLMSQPALYDSMNRMTQFVAKGEQPTQVVGSQGRRGILPSTPNQPAAPNAGTDNAKNTVVLVKDVGGRFPCPYCTNTYIHVKHLRRHLLRRWCSSFLAGSAFTDLL